MDEMFTKVNNPVSTRLPYVSRPGTLAQPPAASGARAETRAGATAESGTFRQTFAAQLQQLSDVAFSKHAVNRAIERNLDLSEDNLARLNEGVRLAAQKNLQDPLILVDNTAFLVNIKHHKVITTVDATELRGNVFTNIDGTVIM